MTDLQQAYRGVRTRLADLLQGASAAELSRAAPATPEWTVRDNLAHLAGVAADIVAGNLADVGGDEWTAAQVERARDRSGAALLEAWTTDASMVEPLIDGFGRAGHQLVTDAVTHEHDIRGGLDKPGARDSDAVDVGFHFVGSALGSGFHATGAPTIVVVHDAGTAAFGSDERAVTVRVSRFEFLRALTGRRSQEQISGYDWDAPIDPATLVLPRFTARPESLEEPAE